MAVFYKQIKWVGKVLQTYKAQNHSVKNKAVLPISNIHKENRNP